MGKERVGDQPMTMFIFGAGFSGKHIGARYAATGGTAFGTTRTEEKFPDLAALKIEPLVFDGETIANEMLDALNQTTHLVVSVAPPRKENASTSDQPVDPVLRALGDHNLSDIAPKLRWIGYLSTVGVYGNHDGAWVDEETPVAPASERSRQRVRAEAEWQTVAETNSLPLAIFRLSGIFGPGRNALVTAEKGKARRLIKKGQVFNRIHVEDIAIAVVIAAQKEVAGIFNITDNEPAPPQDVVTFAHELMGKTPPPEMDFETADLTPMARSFYGENKRVSNAKSKRMLEMEYDWPDYRTALTRMWEEGNWR